MVVQLLKEHGGKGPTRCRTYLEDDVVVVLMRGASTRTEQTLIEDGKWLDVRAARHAFHDTMEGRLTQGLETILGREVQAFMSAGYPEPDLQVQVFVLDRGGQPQAP